MDIKSKERLTAADYAARTERDYAVLLEKGGFRLQRVVPTTSVVSIVEAVPA